MNLLQPARKDAAKVAMKGQTPKSKKSGGGSGKAGSANNAGSNNKKSHVRIKKRKEDSGWDQLMKKIFGSWAADEVVLKGEKAKAAARALDCTYVCI